MAFPASVIKIIWHMDNKTVKNTAGAATPVLTAIVGRLTSIKPKSTAGAACAASGTPSSPKRGAIG